jgi:MFS family permease
MKKVIFLNNDSINKLQISLFLKGWTYGQLGTAFPDIQLILGTNVEQTSLLFTVNSFGYMTGSLTIGFIYDRVQRLKLLGKE